MKLSPPSGASQEAPGRKRLALRPGEEGEARRTARMGVFSQLIAAVDAEGAGALVTVTEASGSSPREAGARMVVRPSGAFHGTIGGGVLEWEALEAARRALARGRGPALRRRVLLGPHLGQCCGGRVDWLIETFDARDLDDLTRLVEAERAGPFATRARPGEDGRMVRILGEPARPDAAPVATEADGSLREAFAEARTPVLLFGAGHVGRALALALAPLPFDIRWIDPRPDAFPSRAPLNARMVCAPEPVVELAAAPDEALVVVMTHSHPLDLAIVLAALAAQRFGYVGLIGSATKRARFLSQMRAASLSEQALSKLVCPIGAPGVEGKEPAVIAAAVAAQLLMFRRPSSGR
jgi:xanthine dehydrogenase accessory factor